LTVLHPDEDTNAEEELTQDLLAIIASFADACTDCALVAKKRSWTVRNRSSQNRRSEVAKTQTLSFPIRLPDGQQAEALRLGCSRPHQSDGDGSVATTGSFVGERTGLAWKQVKNTS